MATSASTPSQSDVKGHVKELNRSCETADWRRSAGRLVHTDPMYGAANAHLMVCGYDSSGFRSGAVAYLNEMARTGNHVTALIAASKAANIEPPATDRGPIDKFFDDRRDRRDDRRDGDAPLPPTTRWERFVAFFSQTC